jgi:pimeloyl-ACP methyl ester carboxylesterase
MANQSGFLDTNGARIYYEVDGNGPAVLMVHAGVANLRMWDAQVEALRSEYRVIRHDTRGYGLTVTDAVEFSNRADMAALLDHLGEKRAHVVGLSRGAMIALDFALEFPDRVRTLAVAAGGVGGYESPEESSPELWEAPDAMLTAKNWEGLAEWEAAFWADGPGQPADRVADVRSRVHDWVLANYRAEKEEGQPQPLDPPAEQRLAALRAPLLVMYGTLDEPATSESMRHLAASVPGSRLERFETAHMINLEEPARFTALLREHFASA